MVWNVYGLKYFNKMRALLHEFDVMIMQETWLNKEKATGAIKNLSEKYNYSIKEAGRKKEGTKKGKLAGRQIIGLKKSTCNG